MEVLRYNDDNHCGLSLKMKLISESLQQMVMYVRYQNTGIGIGNGVCSLAAASEIKIHGNTGARANVMLQR